MAGSNDKNTKMRSPFWTHVERDLYYPAWDSLLPSDTDTAFSGISLAADFHQFALTIDASLRMFFFWLGSFFSATKKEPKPVLAVPRQTNIAVAKKEILRKPTAQIKSVFPEPAPKIPSRGKMRIIAGRLRAQATSPEFWLGLFFGVATRIATRLAIAAAFAPVHGHAAKIAGFAACAGAGFAAGLVVHLVRTRYRNSKLPRDQREKYLNKALVESAVTGLLGGFIGSFATNAGAVIARAGSMAIGMTAGVAAGVLHAGIKGYRDSRGQKGAAEWSKWAIQGAAFGAFGSVLGVLSADLFNAHSSLAASLGEARIVTTPYTQPGITLPVTDPCGLTPCATPPLMTSAPLFFQPVTPLYTVTIGPLGTEAAHAATVTHSVLHPGLDHQADCHHPHHHPLKHVRHIAHKAPPPFETIIIIEPPVMVAPLPHYISVVPIVGPPPVTQPVHYDPCASGNCEAPCGDTTSQADPNQLNVQGPCADSGTSCVEHLSFNEDGIATKAVLEPAASAHQTASAYPVVHDAPYYWNSAAQGTTVASNANDNSSTVSLDVPFNRGSTGGYGEYAPA